MLTEEFWGLRLDDEDNAGPAAETGSLVHAAADEYHKNNASTEAGLAALAAAVPKFPRGDITRATKIFNAYAEDPKNRDAKVVQCEQKILLTLPPSPLDPTGKPVVIRGTLDQVREDDDGTKRVWDIKTGQTYYGTKALNHYAAQQAVYTLAAPGCEPGGLICTDGYFRPGKKVFWKYRNSLKDFKQLAELVVTHVAFARMKWVPRAPGDHCDRCPHKDFETCSQFNREHVK